MEKLPDAVARAWFESRTFSYPELDLEGLARSKRSAGLKVSACLPARNESATIGAICSAIRSELSDSIGLVDELIVIDSGSIDDTREVALRSGARVHAAEDILSDRFPDVHGGKGESLWKSLSVIADDSDIVVWVDSDTRNFSTRFISDLVAPFLEDESILMTKAFYDRPLAERDGLLKTGGARVTELAVRPLINLFYPELSGVVQPLSGEYALRRSAAMQLPFFTGYGVDIGLLLDVCETFGVNSIAQVDLGTRVHRNQDILALGRMAFEVVQVMLRRFEDVGRLKLPHVLPETLVQFLPGADGPELQVHELSVDELEPMISAPAPLT